MAERTMSAGESSAREPAERESESSSSERAAAMRESSSSAHPAGAEHRSMRSRLAPWIEGTLLALAVSLILVLGGEVVRASYHGYLHVALGEAIVREGWRPENPYHAGAPLRYYTLYPWLGVMLGRIGCGPLWGFVILNVMSALLLAPALDALGRELGLGFAARRAAFLAAVLGFNGLGWIGLVVHGTGPFGEPPVYALMPMTFARDAFGWDARLQAFVPKFLNVSSYAIALPFALWAMKEALNDDRRGARALRAIVPLALSVALNPIVGGWAGAVIAVWIAPTLARGTLRERGVWPLAGVASLALASPFLLSALEPAPHGPSLTGNPALGGHPIGNLVGPLILLAVPTIFGIRALDRRVRWKFLVAAAFAAALVLVGEMPQGNEYKMERLLALLCALPAGLWAARMHARGGLARAAAWIAALACVPTTLAVPWAVLAYGAHAASLPLETRLGRLAVRDDLQSGALSPALLAAESRADASAVLVMPLELPGARLSQSLVQGNAIAPALHHALFVDMPQIHNEHMEDLAERIDLVHALYAERPIDALRDLDAISPAQALNHVRGLLPDRELLIVAKDSGSGLSATLSGIGATPLARADGYALWLVPTQLSLLGR
jgi:hypothetical protein